MKIVSSILGHNSIKNESTTSATGLTDMFKLVLDENGLLRRIRGGRDSIVCFDNDKRLNTKKVKLSVNSHEVEVYANEDETEYYISKRLVAKIANLLNNSQGN